MQKLKHVLILRIATKNFKNISNVDLEKRRKQYSMDTASEHGKDKHKPQIHVLIFLQGYPTNFIILTCQCEVTVTHGL